MYMIKLFNVRRSVARESLNLVTGKLPIKYIIMYWRLMYYWHIVHLDKTELVYKVFQAQVCSTDKGDWVTQVNQDLQSINWEVNQEDVKIMSKYAFKKIIKMKIESLARYELEDIKKTHSKSCNLRKFQVYPENFLLSQILTVEEVQTLFQLKTRMNMGIICGVELVSYSLKVKSICSHVIKSKNKF